MTSPAEVIVDAGRLADEGKPYALATVVNVRPPASTRRGDRALITPEGALRGWVGGACSEPIVVREALRAFADGRPRVVRIVPHDELAGREPPAGIVLAENHCASQGTVEVLIEPQLPRRLLAIVGDSPAARTLAELAMAIGWRVSAELAGDPDAVVVATMGRMDEDTLAAALRTGAQYVGLIASSRRASAVLSALRSRGLDDDQLARVRTPAGLDLGPGTQEDIAVAILAELVAWSHTPAATGGAMTMSTVTEAVDPVCGMTIAIAGAEHSAVHGGKTFWFCSSRCRAQFHAQPDRYAFIATEASD